MTFIVHNNVILGENAVIEPFCIIGISPSKEFKKTIIGDNALIRSGTYIYEDNKIGYNFQSGNKVNIRESNKIGNNVSIGTGTIVEHNIVIEDLTRIHSNAFIPEFSILKKESWIGPHVVLTNAKYPKSPGVKDRLQGPTIGENVKIGAGAVILPGITIGRNSLIAAGSVITKSVPENVLVRGNPGKVVCHIKELPNNPYEFNS